MFSKLGRIPFRSCDERHLLDGRSNSTIDILGANRGDVHYLHESICQGASVAKQPISIIEQGTDSRAEHYPHRQ